MSLFYTSRDLWHLKYTLLFPKDYTERNHLNCMRLVLFTADRECLKLDLYDLNNLQIH